MGRINIGIGSDRGTSDRNDFGGILGEAVRYAKFPRNFSYIQGYYPLILSTFILKIIVPSFALFWSLGGINKYIILPGAGKIINIKDCFVFVSYF